MSGKSEVSAAIALAQSLQAQSSTLPFKELSEKCTNAYQALARFDARRTALRDAHAQAVAAVRKREATLLLEQPDLLPARDSEYRKLKEAEQITREQLLALSGDEEKTRQVVNALNSELQARENRLRHLVQTACYDAHKGTSGQRIKAARHALAEALIAYASDRTTPPDGADSGYFFEGIINRGEVNALVRQLVEAERKLVREQIIKRDRTLG
jgi:hypothetical protein